MNTFIWLIAGATAAWSACSVLHLSTARGLTISGIIGAVGAQCGGHVLVPGGALSAFTFRAPFAVLVVCVLGIGSLQLARAIHRHVVGPKSL